MSVFNKRDPYSTLINWCEGGSSYSSCRTTRSCRHKALLSSSGPDSIGDFRSQLEGPDGEAVRRQPAPPGLALPLRELNPED